jgi:hypothetical protein
MRGPRTGREEPWSSRERTGREGKGGEEVVFNFIFFNSLQVKYG